MCVCVFSSFLGKGKVRFLRCTAHYVNQSLTSTCFHVMMVLLCPPMPVMLPSRGS